MNEQTSKDDNNAHEMVAFRIGEQEFCIDIQVVREIRSYVAATPVPHAPAYVAGVINLRGLVLPILDLATTLGFPPAVPTARSAIIVVKTAMQTVGLLVDGVSSIMTVTDDLLQPTPDVASALAQKYAKAIIAMEGRMLTLISVDHLLPERVDLAA